MNALWQGTEKYVKTFYKMTLFTDCLNSPALQNSEAVTAVAKLGCAAC